MLQTDTRADRLASSMIEALKQWEGQVADGKFHLRQYMGGTERGPVFFTEYGEQKAAIKLIPANPQNADSQLARWALAANLTHPHLLRMFQTGRCQVGGGRMVYAVTECADEDLSQIIPQRALSPAETREMTGLARRARRAVSAASRACTTRPRWEREGALRREMFGRWA